MKAAPAAPRASGRESPGLWSALPPAALARAPGLAVLAEVAAGPYALVVLFLLGFGLAVLSTAKLGFPPPAVHDEFSYLLGADTFAHLRLTNPAHPLWRFFETFHVLQLPTYASKYPPGQALALALGQVATGHAIAGVWLCYGLMCAAVLWMLRAWVGPGWGLLIALLFALDLAPTYWAWGYWGGALGTAGGALVIGSVRRLADGGRVSIPATVLLAIGVLVLANTRPYEGAVAVACAAAWLAVRVASRRASGPGPALPRLALPAVAVLAAGAAAMLAYNHAVTGDYLRLPYADYQRQYDVIPIFTWQQPVAPAPSPHRVIAEFQAWEPLCDAPVLFGQSWILRSAREGIRLGFFLLPLPLALVLLLVPALWRDGWMRGAALWLAVSVLALGLASWFQLHYAAAAAGLYLVLLGGGLRRLAAVRRPWAGLGPIAVVGVVGWGLVAGVAGLAAAKGSPVAPWALARQRLEQRLAAGGEHLVVVRYGPRHSPHYEWVYNRADIDASPVVWARDMGAQANQALLRYYPGRTAWRLYVNEDGGPFRLVPYAEAERSPGAEAAAAAGPTWLEQARRGLKCSRP